MGNSAVLVSAVDPYPTDAGKKVVLAGFIEYLTELFGAGNVHYLLVGGRHHDNFPAVLHSAPRPHPVRAVGNVLTRSGTGRASLQESLLRSSVTAGAIRRTLDHLDAELEIYDTVRMAQYANADRHRRQVCYLDDLFSERYMSMLRAAHDDPAIDIQPLGNFAAHVPSPLRPLAASRRIQRGLLTVERALVGRSEDRTARRFQTTLLINESEATRLRYRTGLAADRVRSLPPLITEPVARRDYRGAPEFAFLGLLSLPHNDDGLRSFLAGVWPHVIAARPDARLRVVGRNARPGLRAAVALHGGSVTLEGFIPDLGEILCRSAALVNPLRFGSGVKLKIIEALGRGLPVVTSAVGGDGVASGPGTGVLVSDDGAEMAALLLETTGPSQNAELSSAARDHFAATYSRAAVFAAYDVAFGVR